MIIEKKFGNLTVYFDEEKHRAWTLQDGKRKNLSSVTSYTGIVDKSGVLMAWAVKLMREYLLGKIDNGEQLINVDIIDASKQHTIKRDAAADIGTKIHTWVASWIKGENPELPDDSQVLSGVNAFLEFQNKNNVQFIDSERFIYSAEHNYFGILDAVGIMDGKRVLFEFKSSNGIYTEYAFQAAGYQIAFEEETGQKIDYRMILKFGKEDGSFEFQRYDDFDKDKQAFLACVALKNRIKELEKEQL